MKKLIIEWQDCRATNDCHS